MKNHENQPWARSRSEVNPYYDHPIEGRRIQVTENGATWSSTTLDLGAILYPPSSQQFLADIVNPGERTFNDCVHAKCIRTVEGIQELPYVGDAGQPYLWLSKPGIGGTIHYEGVPTAYALCAPLAPQMWGPDYPHLFAETELGMSLERFDWRATCRQLEREIRVSLNDGFDIANFLLQYKDASQITMGYLTRRGWAENIRKFFKKDGSFGLGSYGRGIAGQRLEHEYGTKTFLSDCSRLFAILVDWQKKQDRLLGKSGERKTFRNGTVSFPIAGHTEVFPYPYFGYDGYTIKCNTTYQNGIVLNSSTAYSYTVSEIKGLLGRIAGLSDQLGLSLDAAPAWNAVPFTFVLDWFLNIGELLHGMRIDWVSTDVTVEDYCRSGKITSDRVIWLCKAGTDLYRLGTVHTSRYVRERDLPSLEVNSIELPDKGWSTVRLKNAGALIVVTVPRIVASVDRELARARSDLRVAKLHMRKLLANELRLARKQLKRDLRGYKRDARRTARWVKRKARKRARIAYKQYRRGRFTILQAISHEWKNKEIILRLQPIEAPRPQQTSAVTPPIKFAGPARHRPKLLNWSYGPVR